MKFKILDEPQFLIKGISIRTNNKNGNSYNDISELWKKFFENDILNKIPNKISNDIYCVYTDYESDYMGDYTTIIDCKIMTTENISDKFILKKIPKMRCELFISEGIVDLGETWNNIWKSDIKRAYIADFDIYDEESFSSKKSKIKTYVSIE